MRSSLAGCRPSGYLMNVNLTKPKRRYRLVSGGKRRSEAGHREDALAFANGLVEHARWSRDAKWLNIAVNEVLGDAEKKFPLDWRIPAARASCLPSGTTSRQR